MSYRNDSVRLAFEQFWQCHSNDTTLQGMMLDTKADILSKEEQPEILSYLPDWQNDDVLELGAGIGRFTSLFARKARQVVAVDFMESFIRKNRENNNLYRNIEFICSDVMLLDFPINAFNLIFTNWLLQYLDDDEIKALLECMLHWLCRDGHLFCRESCWYQAGDVKKDEDPTHYRNPKEYEAFFCSAKISTEDGIGYYTFEIVINKTVEAYAKSLKTVVPPIPMFEKLRKLSPRDKCESSVGC